MAFKHIKNLIATTLSNETLYTVPSGREFVLMRKRVRNAGTTEGTCSFKLGDGDSFEEISFTASDIVKHGQPSKMLLEAGTTVKAWLSAMATGTTVEIMGIELPAGSWVKVKEGIDRLNFTIIGGNYPQINGTYYYVSDERYETEDHSYAVWLQDNQYWEISSLDEEGGPDVNYYYMNDSTGDIENVIGDHTWHDEANQGGESVTLSINRNNNHNDSSSSSENSSSSEPSSSSSGGTGIFAINDGTGNYRKSDGLEITDGPSWVNGNWYRCCDENGNGDGGNHGFWNPISGNYIRYSSVYPYQYLCVVNSDYTYMYGTGDPPDYIALSFGTHSPPINVYNSKDTELWAWELTNINTHQVDSSGTATVSYFTD